MSQDRKARPNEPCPCGSGKKFKKCHGKGKREHQQLQGIVAKEAIIHRLRDWPKAQAFAAEIADFYGDFLKFHENTAYASSWYNIRLKHKSDSVSLQYACIKLSLSTHRVAEALIHELLHLHVPIRGYPSGEKVSIPDELDYYFDRISDMYPKINNLLEHELNIEIFLRLGFEKSNFLGRCEPAPDYPALASKATPSQGYVEEVDFSWWCLEYLRHWITTRHGAGAEVARDADNALHWGSKVHPELEETANKITELIESGQIKDSNQYPQQFNSLLQLMKIPKFTGWVAIQRYGDGKPVATRLDVI